MCALHVFKARSPPLPLSLPLPRALTRPAMCGGGVTCRCRESQRHREREREEAVKITERINTEDGAEEAERLKRILSAFQSRAVHVLHGGRTVLELLSNIYDLRTSTSHIVPSSNTDWPVYALKQGREPPGNAQTCSQSCS